MDYRTEIRNFITDNLSITDEDIIFSDDDNYFELRFVNSLFAMKLVHFVEEKFDIEIESNDLDIKNFSTVNNILALVLKKTTNNTTLAEEHQ